MTGRVIDDSKEYISNRAAADCRLVPQGTLLMSFKLSIGKLAFAGVPLYTNEAIAALTVIDPSRLDSEFLYHFLSAVDWKKYAAGNEKVKGATLNKEKLAAVEIAVPPLAEQKRIVAKLDQLLASTSEYGACLERSLPLLGNLYAAECANVLSKVSGEAIEVDLGSVLELIIDHRGKTPAKLGGDFVDDGVVVVSAIHIKDESIKWAERRRFVTEEMYERWMPEKVKAGDILLTSEAPLGQLARVMTDEPLVLSQRLFALRADEHRLMGDFLFEYLLSPIGQDQLKARATGATAVGIRQSELVKIKLPLPALEVQRTAALRLKELRDTLKDTMSLSSRRIAVAADLRQCVLEAAFRGEL
jgi:type I restriction enzyme S subunit